MIVRAGVIHETLCEPHCLIAQSLQPENARIGAVDQHSLVELIEDDVRRPSRREAQANQRLEVPTRTRLVAQNVQRKTDELTAGRHRHRVSFLISASSRAFVKAAFISCPPPWVCKLVARPSAR